MGAVAEEATLIGCCAGPGDTGFILGILLPAGCTTLGAAWIGVGATTALAMSGISPGDVLGGNGRPFVTVCNGCLAAGFAAGPLVSCWRRLASHSSKKDDPPPGAPAPGPPAPCGRSEEHTSELQSQS